MNKSHKSARLSNDLAFIVSKLERTYPSLTLQLDTVVTEVSSLRLRGNLKRLYVGQNICHHKIGPMVIQDFTVAKLAILA